MKTTEGCRPNLSAPDEPHPSSHYLLSRVVGKKLIKHVRTEHNYLIGCQKPESTRAQQHTRKSGRSLMGELCGFEAEKKKTIKKYGGNTARICFAYNSESVLLEVCLKKCFKIEHLLCARCCSKYGDSKVFKTQCWSTDSAVLLSGVRQRCTRITAPPLT